METQRKFQTFTKIVNDRSYFPENAVGYKFNGISSIGRPLRILPLVLESSGTLRVYI